jgi:Zn-dependent oligopeptidase
VQIRLESLQAIDDYNQVPKAARLQTVSDMYNIIGLSHLQAQKLGYPNVSSMIMEAQNHMASVPEVLDMCAQVADILKPHLPSADASLDAETGAFLATKEKGPTEEDKTLWKAKYHVKKVLYMHGVLQGIVDFCDAMFGIRVVRETTSNEKLLGWSQNVQVLHLYNADDTEEPQQELLGTIYLDAFQDPYWRSESANELVMTSLFSQRQSQTVVPVAIVALKLRPTWDDSPTPLSWDDTRDVLYQFGKALQLILANANAPKYSINVTPPPDVSEFMAAVRTILSPLS